MKHFKRLFKSTKNSDDVQKELHYATLEDFLGVIQNEKDALKWLRALHVIAGTRKDESLDASIKSMSMEKRHSIQALMALGHILRYLKGEVSDTQLDDVLVFLINGIKEFLLSEGCTHKLLIELFELTSSFEKAIVNMLLIMNGERIAPVVPAIKFDDGNSAIQNLLSFDRLSERYRNYLDILVFVPGVDISREKTKQPASSPDGYWYKIPVNTVCRNLENPQKFSKWNTVKEKYGHIPDEHLWVILGYSIYAEDAMLTFLDGICRGYDEGKFTVEELEDYYWLCQLTL